MEHSGDDWDHFVEVARAMRAESGVSQTLDRAVKGATDIITHCDHAGISLVRFGRPVETPAASDDVARRGDELQYELDDGPCLQSIRQQETVQSDDLLLDDRWPRWSASAVDELGIRSMLCFQLFVTHDSLGALNLYSHRPNAFDSGDRAVGLALAAHVAVALSAATAEEGLESALVNRAVIGQAQGMLMQRYGLNGEQAFSVLTRSSQQSNRRVYVIAGELVKNGIGWQA